ncbi:VOC family protein [Paucibacter sp. TC2R-5]|uniref:VOC family protein n=1 Tax=Paucibacter sp. TC2R-5 TaxID=2893555 RepID=UPI0021E4EADF|nr:VOC family protein [Paucibacter sp. TC2R-5]MCV2361244.1 VOC family protein [Paucibacter sp. TC2R-5]
MSAHNAPMLSHVGIYARDVERMVRFYSELFNLRVTDRGCGRTFKNDLVFMSAHPSHHHQLVISSGRPPEATFSTVMQLSFRAEAIDDLRRIGAASPGVGATKLITLNHGNALSLYFNDPEGNTVEVYFETPFYVSQPHGDPLDLSKSDAELLSETEANCRADPSFMTVEQWQRNFGRVNSET